jgi:pimeloyl-ACP methyl ester carboxylesterase
MLNENSQKAQNQLSVGRAKLSRRTVVKQLGMVAAAGAVALSVAPTLALAADNQTDKSVANAKPSGFNVLLVHGAFVDASSWNQVTGLLQGQGHNVLAVELPLTSLAEDVTITQQALATLSGPTVVVGHSYGGAVISAAATGAANVIGLVYVAAFAPAEGQSINDLGANFPPPALSQHLALSYRPGYIWADPAFFHQVIAADLPLALSRVLAVTQKPIVPSAFAEPSGPVAWGSVPTYFLVSKQDQAINPDVERAMAKNIKATTVEINSSHASPASHPDAVVSLIETAIKQCKKTH